MGCWTILVIHTYGSYLLSIRQGKDRDETRYKKGQSIGIVKVGCKTNNHRLQHKAFLPRCLSLLSFCLSFVRRWCRCPFAVMCLSLCRRRPCFRSAVVYCTFVPCAVRFSLNFGITTDTNGKSTCISIERPIRRNYRGFAQTYSIKCCDPWMMYSPMFKFTLLCRT